MQKRIVLGIILIVLAVSVGFLVYYRRPANTPVSPTDITVSGTIVRLPHKDTSGPITLECAMGLQAENKDYYALPEIPQSKFVSGEITTGKHISVTGILTPSTPQEKYDIVGAIQVREIN